MSGRSARRPSKFVLYAGKDFLGWGGSSGRPTLSDRAADVVDLELARPRALIATRWLPVCDFPSGCHVAAFSKTRAMRLRQSAP